MQNLLTQEERRIVLRDKADHFKRHSKMKFDHIVDKLTFKQYQKATKVYSTAYIQSLKNFKKVTKSEYLLGQIDMAIRLFERSAEYSKEYRAFLDIIDQDLSA